MRVLNKDNVEILDKDVDYSAGELTQESILKIHHEKVCKLEEQSHYKIIKEYDNGGKDVEQIIDVAGVEAKDAYDEFEDILRYTLYSPDKLEKIKLQQEATEIQQWFDSTDYICFKVLRGNWLKTDSRYKQYLKDYEIKNARLNEIEALKSSII